MYSQKVMHIIYWPLPILVCHKSIHNLFFFILPYIITVGWIIKFLWVTEVVKFFYWTSWIPFFAFKSSLHILFFITKIEYINWKLPYKIQCSKSLDLFTFSKTNLTFLICFDDSLDCRTIAWINIFAQYITNKFFFFFF